MAEKVSLKAEKREALGTRVSRRFRLSGKIPAVLARKGDAPAHLLVDAREFGRVLKKHVRVIELAHPAGTDKVFLKEIQYDHLAEHVIHIDFTRIAKDELVTVEVALILKGKPTGVADEGGVLDQYVKTLKIQYERFRSASSRKVPNATSTREPSSARSQTDVTRSGCG